MPILLTLIHHHLRLGLRRAGDSFHLLAFFLMAVTLFPLGLGPELPLLQKIAPGIIWVCALLAAMLSLPTLLREDADDGTLEQYLLLPIATEWLILAKATAHWLLSGLPLVIISPLLALMLNIREESILPLILSLLLGTPTLSLLGTMGAAITINLRRGGMILLLILLPLAIPVLIFGTGAATVGFETKGNWMLLIAALLSAIPLTLLSAGASLRAER